MFLIKYLGDKETSATTEEVTLNSQLYGRYELSRSWQGLDTYAFFKSEYKPGLTRLRRDIDYYISGSELVITKEAVTSGRVELGKVLLVGSQALIIDFNNLPSSFDLFYSIQPKEKELYNVKIEPKIKDEFKEYFKVYLLDFSNDLQIKDSLEIEILDSAVIFGLRIIKLVEQVNLSGIYEFVELEVTYSALTL